jgi:hypothetical protein
MERTNWEDVRKEIYTPEEIKACDARVAKAVEEIHRGKEEK